MAENLFAMLQKAQETASTADSKMFGVEVGIVTNVKDDKKLGRVKVCFPRLATKDLPKGPETDWVRVVQPALHLHAGALGRRPDRTAVLL